MVGSKGSFNFVDVPLSESNIPGESGYQKSKFYVSRRNRLLIIAVAAAVLVLCLIIGIAVVSKQKNEAVSKLESMKSQQQIHESTTIPPITKNTRKWPLSLGYLSLDENVTFTIRNGSTIKSLWKHSLLGLSSSKAIDCSSNSKSHLCLKWENDRTLNITKSSKTLKIGNSLDCYDIEWSGLRNTYQSLTDCFDITSAHWYGGYEDTYQYWPFEKNTMPLSPYVSNDAFKNGIGNVLDRYFISSNGVGILVDNDVPLYFSLNKPLNDMCFTAKYKRYPYFNTNNAYPKLKYKVCQAKNVRDIQRKMSANFLNKPKGIPHEDLFRYPIWSTWAQYHYDINQTTVLKFTDDVLKNGFRCSQIEIDDNWTPYYGDFVFDKDKFSNATEMVIKIKNQGCAVTAWVHPFFNIDGSFFKEANDQHYLLRQVGSDVPALTKWWDGNMTGVLDVSNEDAVIWYLDKLNKLKNDTQLDSFKFDAGELSFLPNIYKATNMPPNPCDNYPRKYVDLAVRADTNRRQEVRGGYKTQKFPIFVRQIDKKSAWGHNNSFASIIPGIFTFGILGYPFVLPDMIGGNAYDGRFPEPELFVRWIQLNTFLPSMQLSITPWDERFNDTNIDVVSISRNFTELHANISDVLIKFANLSVETGEPIIRPLWWIDPLNETALTCEDEFLVGDEYLVAPIMEKGSRSRDIYIPTGSWLDMLRGNGTDPVYMGPLWVYNYTVEIDELAYFKNIIYV